MYIGNDLQIAHPSYKIIDDISSGFNGSQTSFALQVSGATPVPFPISTQQVMISVNGVVQEPDPNGSAGFKLLGSNIVFSSAPANGHAFFGVINAGADYVTAGSEFPDGSSTAPSFTFQDDQDTGWFRSGSGAVGFSANGVNTIGFDGNGLTVTGDATFTGDSSKNMFWDKSDGQLEFADNAKAVFGGGSDVSIYHDGSNSYIKSTGTGNLLIDQSTANVLYLRSDDLRLSSWTGTETYIDCNVNGTVELFHNNVKKFETTSVGAQIDGRLVVNNSGYGALIVMNNDDSADGAYIQLFNDSSSPADNDVLGLVNFRGNDSAGNETGYASIRAISTDVTDGSESADITFGTRHNNSFGERMRIDSSGKVGIGTTSLTGNLSIASGTYQSTTPLSTADDIVISGNQSLGISLITAAAGTSNNTIAFGDTDDTDIGMIRYAHANNSLQFTTNTAEQMRIDSSGRLLLGTTTAGFSYGDNLTIADSGDCGISIRSGTSSEGNLFFSDGTSGNDQIRGYVQYNHSNNNLILATNAATALTLDSSQNATFAGTVSDSKGDLRKIPNDTKTSAYTLVASDSGKMIRITTGGVTVPNSVFAEGDAVSIINQSGSDQTITAGAGFTLYSAADGSAGNRILAGRGMATMMFAASDAAYISGAGLS